MQKIKQSGEGKGTERTGVKGVNWGGHFFDCEATPTKAQELPFLF